MKTKSLFLTGALALASLAYGKSYDIVLSAPTMAGNVQLKAGEYKLKVENGAAIFTDVESAKQFSAPVTVETVNTKFGGTAVDTLNVSGSEHIQSIELGGSKTKLEFTK